MENRELLLAITELKSSMDKRFDELEKQVDSRLDKAEEQLYKLSRAIHAGEVDQEEDIQKLGDGVKDLRLSAKYLLSKISEHDVELYKAMNMLKNTSDE
ncbi:hypothetical protein SLL00_11810 [Metabacillus indicus]|uniref:hypothetical protein n=1 Tax=Metabacillus indicus TaxID=246786 RepID=UPI002A0466AA|nr:hypothetical protein [Metabacillus indicus]MDX8290485.1 hypothetical protein [Metabacillus indicus]